MVRKSLQETIFSALFLEEKVKGLSKGILVYSHNPRGKNINGVCEVFDGFWRDIISGKAFNNFIEWRLSLPFLDNVPQNEKKSTANKRSIFENLFLLNGHSVREEHAILFGEVCVGLIIFCEKTFPPHSCRITKLEIFISFLT